MRVHPCDAEHLNPRMVPLGLEIMLEFCRPKPILGAVRKPFFRPLTAIVTAAITISRKITAHHCYDPILGIASMESTLIEHYRSELQSAYPGSQIKVAPDQREMVAEITGGRGIAIVERSAPLLP